MSTDTEFSNSWEGVVAAATKAGTRYPELVAAQWALESGWGKHTSGRFNYFGLKSATLSGTVSTTQEVLPDGTIVTIDARFKDFESLYHAVSYLVDKWYKDWGTYSGVDRQATRERAAKMLVVYGYATDPHNVR
jgi:flagellum-specific peptidoglycan hydrolase FlgJ